jgi:hypothetical protein
MMLQSRSIDAVDELKLVPIPFDINLTFNTGMRFCPFCGTAVKDIVPKNPEVFAELARAHERFQVAKH